MDSPSPREGLVRRTIRAAAWCAYLFIVFEVIFTISPLAAVYYKAYGPLLSLLNRREATAWLTQFNLPRYSHTGAAAVDVLPRIGAVLLTAGLLLFAAAAVPLYASKISGRGAVVRGLYRYIRHPQFVTLAIMAVGAVLMWPRMIAWLMFVLMLYLYWHLGRWEEARCAAKYGEAYREYRACTGMMLPRAVEQRLLALRALVPIKWRAPAAGAALVAALAAAAWGGDAARAWSLGRVASYYSGNVAALSPARLSADELRAAYELALTQPRAEKLLSGDADNRWIIHIVPRDWRVPELPIGGAAVAGGRHQPREFDRYRLHVLFSRAALHEPDAAGPRIVLDAHTFQTLLRVTVDVESGQALEATDVPPHPLWSKTSPPSF